MADEEEKNEKELENNEDDLIDQVLLGKINSESNSTGSESDND